jgi:hypothetical protein
MMRNAGYGVHLLTALSLLPIAIVCFAFVDDTDTVQSGSSVDATGEEVLLELQAALDLWEGALRATGGALDPSKSFWYLIDFVWDNKKFRYRTIEEMPGDLVVKDHQRVPAVLRRFEVSHSEKTLGVFVAMDGNIKAQKEYLLGISKEYADRIRTRKLHKNDAMYTFRASLLPSLEYCLIASTLRVP